MKNLTRRGSIAKIAELASTIPLIRLLINNFFKSRIYYELNFSYATLHKQPTVVSDFYASQSTLQEILEELWNAYEDAYYKMHTRLVPYIDAKGNPGVHTQTYWEWEEPHNVPRHEEIKRWRDTQN